MTMGIPDNLLDVVTQLRRDVDALMRSPVSDNTVTQVVEGSTTRSGGLYYGDGDPNSAADTLASGFGLSYPAVAVGSNSFLSYGFQSGLAFYGISPTQFFLGSDISNPSTTSFSVFSAAQTYNTESMAAGSVLFGDNSTGKANMLWNPATGQLLFRGGQTTQIYINTQGQLVAGSVILDSTGLNLGGINAQVSLNQVGYIISQDVVIGANERLFRTGVINNNGYPEGRIEFTQPGSSVTIPNGDFSSLDMTSWTQVQTGYAYDYTIYNRLNNGGQEAHAFAVNGSDLYIAASTLGTHASMVSKYSGGVWSDVGTLTTVVVFDLCWMGGNLYAACGADGVYKWNGATWASYGSLSSSNYAISLAAIGSNLYVGLNGTIGAVTSSVWVSLAGANFTAVSTLTTTFAISSLAVIGTDLYAGILTGASSGSAIRKRTGEAGAWANYGNLSTTNSIWYHTLIANGSDLYACATVSSTSGVVKSAAGANFTDYAAFSMAGSWGLAFSGSDLYVGGAYGVQVSKAGANAVYYGYYNQYSAGYGGTAIYLGNLAFVSTALYALTRSGGSTAHDMVAVRAASVWSGATGAGVIVANMPETAPEITNAARFAVTAGNTYVFSARTAAANVNASVTNTITVTVKFYTASSGGSLVSTVTIISRSAVGDLPSQTGSATITVPATATYAVFDAYASSTAYQLTQTFDNFTVVLSTVATSVAFQQDGAIAFTIPTTVAISENSRRFDSTIGRTNTPVTFGNNTTKNTLYSKTIVGGTLGTTGAIIVRGFANFSNAAGGARTITIRVSFGGTELTIYSESVGASGYRNIHFEILIRNNASVSSQVIQSTVSVAATSGANQAVWNDRGTAIINTSSDADVAITSQWTTSVSGNTITLEGAEVDFAPAV